MLSQCTALVYLLFQAKERAEAMADRMKANELAARAKAITRREELAERLAIIEADTTASAAATAFSPPFSPMQF